MEIAEKPFKISENTYIKDLCLYIEDLNTLVIGDAHLGYEESLNKQGVLIPKFQFKEIMERLKKIIDDTNPETIIVVGDLKHEFGTISNEEWRDTLDFIDLLQENAELILIKGNHDTILEPIAEKKDVEIHDHYTIGEYYFCHGHKIPEDLEFQNASTIIIGHEHPAIGLKDGPRVETYKCFLKGKNQDKEIIVLPSLSTLPKGTDVLKEQIQSPFLKDLSNFKAFIVEDEVYDFGKIKELKS